MLKNGILGTTGIVLLSGSLLLLWFIILSGLTDIMPFNKVFFLRADTSDISGARDITQWTYFFFCGDNNKDCGRAIPAPAFGRAWDGNADNVPDGLIGSYGGDTTSHRYYYLWRFGWVFIIITLFFEALAFFAAFLACCGRLGAAIASMMAFIALFFHSLGSSLMTATFVMARNAFRRSDRNASIGKYAFGFMWASWAALFLSVLLFVIGIKTNKSSKDATASSGGGFASRFRRNRSTRSRSYDGRRVKEEYS